MKEKDLCGQSWIGAVVNDFNRMQGQDRRGQGRAGQDRTGQDRIEWCGIREVQHFPSSSTCF
jgi:hypothetical protein